MILCLLSKVIWHMEWINIYKIKIIDWKIKWKNKMKKYLIKLYIISCYICKSWKKCSLILYHIIIIYIYLIFFS